MDDSVTVDGEIGPLTFKELGAVLSAMDALQDAMDKLGSRVEETNDIIYTFSQGGQSFTIETDDIEQEAEDNVDFLKDSHD